MDPRVTLEGTYINGERILEEMDALTGSRVIVQMPAQYEGDEAAEKAIRKIMRDKLKTLPGPISLHSHTEPTPE